MKQPWHSHYNAICGDWVAKHNRTTRNGVGNCISKPDLDARAKKDDFEALFKRIFRRKITSAKMEKICWQITVAAFMQPLQYDLGSPAAKDNSITHAATAWSNLDTAITMRSAETELQNTIELRATASEIVSPKPDLDARAKKDDFEALFKRIFRRKITSAKNAFRARLPSKLLDAAIPMRSAETELQNTRELRAMASEIVAPKPDGSRCQSGKKTILKHFLKGFLEGKSLAPKWRKSANKSLSQPSCSHSNTIYEIQLQETLRMQPSKKQPWRSHSNAICGDWVAKHNRTTRNGVGNCSSKTGSRRQSEKKTILKHFLKGFLEGKSLAPNGENLLTNHFRRRGRSSRFGDGLSMEKHRVSCICYLSKTHFRARLLQNSIGNSSTSTTCNPIYNAGTILELQITMEFCQPHMHEKQLKPHLQCGTDPTMIREYPRMIRPHTRPSRTRRTAEVDHRRSGTDFVWKNIGFRASAISQKRISCETSFKTPSATHPPAPLAIPFTVRERS